MSGKKLLLLALSAFALLLGGGFWLWDLHTRSVLADAQQRLRDARLPMTVDDIRPPPVPDADNAALVLERVRAQFASVGLLDKLFDFQSRHKELRLDESATQELAGLLGRPDAHAALALIHDAVARKGYDVKMDYTKVGSATFPLVGTAQQSARLLGWHARLLAGQGQADEASKEVEAMLTLAEFFADEPILISFLSRMAIWRMAMMEVGQLAATGDMSPAWGRRFSDRLAGFEHNLSKELARTMDGERILFGQWAFGNLLNAKTDVREFIGVEPNGLKRLLLQRYRLSGVIRLEFAHYLDRMVELRAAALFASHDRELLARRLGNLAPIPPARELLALLGSTTERLMESLLKFRAQLVVTQVGLALERYRVAKGGYPAALADLAPEFIPSVPVDVFTGKPLIYRPEPGGSLTYSVGPNLKDDGGIEDSDDDKDDISWASGAAAARKYAVPPPPSANADGDGP